MHRLPSIRVKLTCIKWPTFSFPFPTIFKRPLILANSEEETMKMNPSIFNFYKNLRPYASFYTQVRPHLSENRTKWSRTLKPMAKAKFALLELLGFLLLGLLSDCLCLAIMSLVLLGIQVSFCLSLLCLNVRKIWT